MRSLRNGRYVTKRKRKCAVRISLTLSSPETIPLPGLASRPRALSGLRQGGQTLSVPSRANSGRCPAKAFFRPSMCFPATLGRLPDTLKAVRLNPNSISGGSSRLLPFRTAFSPLSSPSHGSLPLQLPLSPLFVLIQLILFLSRGRWSVPCSPPQFDLFFARVQSPKIAMRWNPFRWVRYLDCIDNIVRLPKRLRTAYLS